jgi:hypothetical protein
MIRKNGVRIMCDEKLSRITIIDKKNNKTYYVKCSEVPPPNGVGNLTIPHVSRQYKIKNDKEYEELRIPSTCDTSRAPINPGQNLIIYLGGKLKPDRMVLPYGDDADDPCDHFTFKLKVMPQKPKLEDLLDEYSEKEIIQVILDRIKNKDKIIEILSDLEISTPTVMK